MKEDIIENEVVDNSPVETAASAEENAHQVGSLLKEMREQKKLKIQDVSKKLCIRKVYLQAIEDSNYEEIPPYPYGIGFIRSYADFLGLNSANIIQLYKDETETDAKKNNNYYVPEPQLEASVPSKKYLLISLLALFAVYVGWYALNNNEEVAESDIAIGAPVTESAAPVNDLPLVVEDYAIGSGTPAESAAVEEKAAEEGLAVIDTANLPEADNNQIKMTDKAFVEPAPVAQAPAVAEPAAPKTEEVSAAKPDSRVLIKAKKETWVEVKDGEKLYISKVLQPGDTYSVPAGSGMILSVGKIDGVDVLVDGKLTSVVQPNKKTNIALDPFLNANH